jgi:hypothetical protein
MEAGGLDSSFIAARVYRGMHVEASRTDRMHVACDPL